MAGIVTQTRDFLEGVREQMQKVTWPDWPQLKNSTFIIVVFVFIVALLIFGMDQSVSYILRMLQSILGS